MTFADRTFYPISSRNDKDFLNLMRVYLDAVFHPLIYSKPEIFRQEGWHYEFGEDGGIGYKGVVYNEMRGAFSDADELADAALLAPPLFPASPYRFVSGGDPEHIPELSYEAFVDSPPPLLFPRRTPTCSSTARWTSTRRSRCSAASTSTAPCPARASPRLRRRGAVKAASQTLRYELPGDEEGEKRCRLYWGRRGRGLLRAREADGRAAALHGPLRRQPGPALPLHTLAAAGRGREYVALGRHVPALAQAGGAQLRLRRRRGRARRAARRAGAARARGPRPREAAGLHGQHGVPDARARLRHLAAGPHLRPEHPRQLDARRRAGAESRGRRPVRPAARQAGRGLLRRPAARAAA